VCVQSYSNHLSGGSHSSRGAEAPDAELLRPDYDDLRTLTQGQATDYENSCHWPFRKRPDNA